MSWNTYVNNNLDAINGALSREPQPELLLEYLGDNDRRKYAYYSPRRPLGLRHLGGHRTGDSIVSYRYPQPVETMLSEDIYPLNNAARVEWIKSVAIAWDDNYILLQHKEQMLWGAVVGWDATEETYKALYYNGTGWTGDSVRNTLEAAILAAIEMGAVKLADPAILERIVEYWRDE